MSSNSPKISTSISGEDNLSNSTVASSETIGNHLLRKRHSPSSVSKEGTSSSDTAAFSKLRKVSTSNTKAGNASQHGNNNADSPGTSKGLLTTTSGSSSTTSSSSGSKRNSQLKYLTDYFPNQISNSEFRLTRSRSKATCKQNEVSNTSSSGATSSYRSQIPINQDKHSKKQQCSSSILATTSDSSQNHCNRSDINRRFDNVPIVSSNRNNTTQSISSNLNIGDVKICLSSIIPPNLDSHAQPQSSFTPFILPTSNNISLLGTASNLTIPFSLNSMTPSVIMNISSTSQDTLSSTSSLSTQQRSVAEISTIASQLAAAVVGGASQSTITDITQNLSVVVSSANVLPLDYMHNRATDAHSSSSLNNASGLSLPPPIGINRSSLSIGNYSINNNSGSKASSSVFGLRSHPHVNRATTFLGSLVPRMQHLLSSGSNSNNSGNNTNLINNNSNSDSIPAIYRSSVRIISIVDGLRSSNEIRQSEAASELAEMLLLGNEESLPNMPVRDIIQCLMALLQKDHNFELMLTAARCITNMQEALPRALPIITEAIPLLLQKLKRIEYIDVAEQSLIALEVMSRRNAKNILSAGGVAATISHVDFFSLPSQRLAFQIAANCATYVTFSEFALIKDCLSDLTQRLHFFDDKRCIESICTFFNRLIENIRNYPERLREVAGPNHDFLKNVQQLLMIQPSTLGSNTFLNLLKSLHYMCSKCGDIAVALINIDFGRTLRYLLIGHDKSDDISFDVSSRPLPQLREIIELIGELMPNLPNTEVSEITNLLDQYTNVSGSLLNSQMLRAQYPFEILTTNWYVMNESNTEWRLLDTQEARDLDRAKATGDQIAIIELEGEVFEVDFIRMVRKNSLTGVESSLDRRITSENLPINKTFDSSHNSTEVDERDLLKRNKNETFLDLIAMLCPLLVEVGTSTTCSSLRFETLKVMVRMIYAVESETALRNILKEVSLAIYISSTLSCNKSFSVIVSAIQLVHILLDKIPHLYVPLLESEGVFYEIEKLSKLKSTDENKSLTFSLLQQSSLTASGRSLASVTQSITAISTSNTVTSTSGVNSRVGFTLPQLATSNLSDLSLSSYLAAAAAVVNASNNGTFASHYNLNNFQQQIQRHSALGQQQSSGGNYHHILRSHVPLSSSLPQSIAGSSSLSSVSAVHLQQMCRQQLQQDQISLSNNASSRPASNVSQYQQQQFSHSSDNNSSSTATIQQQQSQIAQAAAAAAATFLPSSINQNLLSSSMPAQSSSYFNAANATSSNLTSSEILLPNAQATFSNLQMSLSGQQSLSLFPISQVGVISSLPYSNQQNSSVNSLQNNLSSDMTAAVNTGSSLSSAAASQSHVALKQGILCRLQEYAYNEARQICLKYTGEKAVKYGVCPSSNVLNSLSKIAKQLSIQNRDVGCESLNTLNKILIEKEISAFQLNHSGIISALNFYLTDNSNKMHPSRKLRLRRFAAIFMFLTPDNLHPLPYGSNELVSFEKLINKVILAIGQLEQFQVKITNLSGIIQANNSGAPTIGSGSLLNLSALMSTTYLRGAQALRFFQTHQIRCNLKRHPSCKQLRDWRHGRGSIKVDPFTSISAIERYLLDRGIGLVSGQADDSSDNDDISEDEQDFSYSSSASYSGRIELYIGENKIPSDISILQAICQYSLPHDNDSQENIPSSIWITAHTLYYKIADGPNTSAHDSSSPAVDFSSATSSSNPTSINIASVIRSVGTGNLGLSFGSSSSSNSLNNNQRRHHRNKNGGGNSSNVDIAGTSSIITNKSGSKKALRLQNRLATSSAASSSTTSSLSHRKEKYSTSLTKDSQVFKDGKIPVRPSPLLKYLKNTLDEELNDFSTDCLILIKTLFGLNTYWWALFDDECFSPPLVHSPVLPAHVFHSSKLNSKVLRQLSDFLSVATQQIPKWTINIVKVVPFIFPFITRRNLMYCTSFGRDRALMHLVNEVTGDEHDSESTSRLIPRLERKKVSINRNNLLKDAQQMFNQLGNSKAMLEVGFEGEVGTGFGPTLEFYSTLSREFQKFFLKMWNGTSNKVIDFDKDGGEIENEYIVSENGLYPCIYRPNSSKQIEARIKKFEFFGRLLAQSLMDSRMLDIPIASTFFKWLIGEEDTLGLNDLEILEPTIYKSLQQLNNLSEKDFADLETYFMFPGENSFEMIKNGKNILVTKMNCNQFINLVCYWRLVEGIRPEMEAVRRGFQTVTNPNLLKIFFDNEVEQLFCGCPETGDEKIWSKAALQQAIRPDHGFTHDSIQITWLIEMLNTFKNEKRRKFLQFVTGSPRLPVGGFRSLNPPLTVVRKIASYGNSENELPSAMTCYNYLKIPPYESYKTFVDRFEVALQFIYSFHLT